MKLSFSHIPTEMASCTLVSGQRAMSAAPQHGLIPVPPLKESLLVTASTSREQQLSISIYKHMFGEIRRNIYLRKVYTGSRDLLLDGYKELLNPPSPTLPHLGKERSLV